MNGARNSGRDGPPLAGAGGAARRPILIAAVAFAVLVVGALAYVYGDDALELASPLVGARAIHNQGHIRY